MPAFHALSEKRPAFYVMHSFPALLLVVAAIVIPFIPLFSSVTNALSLLSLPLAVIAGLLERGARNGR